MERHRLKRGHTTSLCADQNRFWLSTAVHKVEIHYAQRTSDHLSEEFLSPHDAHTPCGWHKPIVWMAARPPQRTAQPGCTLSKQEHPVPLRCGQRGRRCHAATALPIRPRGSRHRIAALARATRYMDNLHTGSACRRHRFQSMLVASAHAAQGPLQRCIHREQQNQNRWPVGHADRRVRQWARRSLHGRPAQNS